MPYKESWGEQAKARAKRRKEYYVEYNRKRDQLKKRARYELLYAVKTGKIKSQPCRDLGSECQGRVEGHHPDYSKPLDVIWLCARHHRDEHNRTNKPENLNCLHCGVEIHAPRKKYCSDRCGLRMWVNTNKGV